VVVNLTYPPGEQPISRLHSGIRSLINRSPRPVLATPQTVSPLNHALLAFDNSAKAREALFVATYLVKKWGIPLDIVSIEDSNRIDANTLDEARTYLQKHGAQASYHLESGDPGEVLMQMCEQQACDLIIMGGYGHSPVLEVVLGSTVDQVLRQSNVPSLICR
jgi:nucleotide-binding universal stress UspA family protein